MSTDFRFYNKEIPMVDLTAERLGKFGISLCAHPDTGQNRKLLRDQTNNYLWVYGDDSGNVAWMTRYGPNSPIYIIFILERVFNAEIVGEYDYRFWGAESQEAFDGFISGDS